MPAPLASPVLQEDFCLLVSISTGCHRTSWTPLLWDWWLFCAHSARRCGSPVSPLCCCGVQCRTPPAPPMGVQSMGVQARGDHATVSGRDGGQSFSSTTTSDIPLNPPFWLWQKKPKPIELQWGTPLFSPVEILSALIEVIKPHTSLLWARRKDTKLNKCCSLFFREKLTQLERGFSLFLKDVH